MAVEASNLARTREGASALDFRRGEEGAVLWQRLAVAAVGIPLLVVAILAPEPVFAVVVEAALAVAAYEMYRVAAPFADRSVAVAAAAAAALFIAVVRVTEEIPLEWMVVLLAAVLALLLRPRGARAALGDSPGGWWLASVLYPGVLGAHLVLLRSVGLDAGEDGFGFDVPGQRWLVVMLASVWAADTAAYAVGKAVGRRRLWPAVSPGKTWEGTIAGLLAGAAVAAAIPPLLDLEADVALRVAIVVGLPLAAVLGDLLESAIKRRLGVKDFSGLLPGHGGMLDRMDSWLAAGALLYWLLQWLPT